MLIQTTPAVHDSGQHKHHLQRMNERFSARTVAHAAAATRTRHIPNCHSNLTCCSVVPATAAAFATVPAAAKLFFISTVGSVRSCAQRVCAANVPTAGLLTQC